MANRVSTESHNSGSCGDIRFKHDVILVYVPTMILFAGSSPARLPPVSADGQPVAICQVLPFHPPNFISLKFRIGRLGMIYRTTK